MRVLKSMAVVAALVGMTACGEKQTQAPPADLSFLDSLELTPALAQDSSRMGVSPLELGMMPAEEAKEEVATEEKVVKKAAPKSSSSSSTAKRRSSSSTRTASASSGGDGSYGGSSGGYEPAPVRTRTVKHTKRDAAIGAGAGAVIGAVAGGSRNRVKGAVIGAVVGGVAGAVIGNNVDKQTVAY